MTLPEQSPHLHSKLSLQAFRYLGKIDDVVSQKDKTSDEAKRIFGVTFILQWKWKDGSFFTGWGAWGKEGGVNQSDQQQPCSLLLPPSHSVCADRSHIKQPAENSARPVYRCQWLGLNMNLFKCLCVSSLLGIRSRSEILLFFFKRSVSKYLTSQIIFLWFNTTHKRWFTFLLTSETSKVFLHAVTQQAAIWLLAESHKKKRMKEFAGFRRWISKRNDQQKIMEQKDMHGVTHSA